MCCPNDLTEYHQSPRPGLTALCLLTHCRRVVHVLVVQSHCLRGGGDENPGSPESRILNPTTGGQKSGILDPVRFCKSQIPGLSKILAPVVLEMRDAPRGVC